MHLDLDVEGNPISAFVASLPGRNIDLMVEGASAHPRQIIGAKATAVGRGVERVMDRLGAVQAGDSMPLDATELCEDFRRLIYDATELFDVYSQLVPDRLEKAGRTAKSAVATYRAAAKRLRDPWALMCNKFKHGGSRLAYNRAVSTEGRGTSHGYILISPRDGTSMILDEQVHRSPERRATFARKLHELVHAILRTDLNAAKLVRALPDCSAPPIAINDLSFPFYGSLQSLAAARIVVGAEPSIFDGVGLPGDGTLRLIRKSADAIINAFHGTTQYVGDGHSTTFSFI